MFILQDDEAMGAGLHPAEGSKQTTEIAACLALRFLEIVDEESLPTDRPTTSDYTPKFLEVYGDPDTESKWKDLFDNRHIIATYEGRNNVYAAFAAVHNVHMPPSPPGGKTFVIKVFDLGVLGSQRNAPRRRSQRVMLDRVRWDIGPLSMYRYS